MNRSARRGKHHPKMDLQSLPKQEKPDLAPSVSAQDELEEHKLLGKFCDEEPIVGDLKDICVGDDVCVYTASKQGRPWVGRVTNCLEGNKFTIQWFKREGRSRHFKAMVNPEGVPNCCELDLDTVMFWSMTENKSENRFLISPYWMDAICHEYNRIDAEREEG